MEKLPFIKDDGGRILAGFRGEAGDCVTRSIAIVTGLPYQDIYNALAHGNKTQRRSQGDPRKQKRTARSGISTKRKWFKDYMVSLGFTWVPCMEIGSGCKVHLNASELPTNNKIIVSLSKHYAAVVNGVLRDTYDCSREGKRCVYGYWRYNK